MGGIPLKDNCISRVQLVLIQSFPFPRVVNVPRLKRPVHFIIYSYMGNIRIHAFFKDISLK